MEEGREKRGEGMGEGADTVPLGTFSPSLSPLSLFFNSIHPLKNNQIRGSQMFLGVMAVAEISHKCLKRRLTAKIKKKSLIFKF